MKYNKPEDVCDALKEHKVKVQSLNQYISKLKRQGKTGQVDVLEKGLSLWKSESSSMCTFHNKPIDDLSLPEILDMYDKDKRLLTINHCKRFTILMTLDSSVSINEYEGMVLHPRDVYLDDE